MKVTRTRPSVAARRFGYVLAAAINVGFWVVINVWPGWRELSFLTDETPEVLGLVNVSLAVSIAVNLVYTVHDPPWLKALGDLLTTAVGVAVLVRLWDVFPFDFSDYSFNWAMLGRVVLLLGIVGSCIGMLVQLVTMLRLLMTHQSERGGSS